ncbi:hypothetical protein Anapl_06407 [Anas platyrhynchos]|uniref:Uncharacterized protein n=1 Tax=Anas platyrhynchos TaxID=8839 RepID=R0LYF1_ANAPL|nr:hypothetical protein Anapl_06407 [Anas platyrhynchos]
MDLESFTRFQSQTLESGFVLGRRETKKKRQRCGLETATLPAASPQHTGKLGTLPQGRPSQQRYRLPDVLERHLLTAGGAAGERRLAKKLLPGAHPQMNACQGMLLPYTFGAAAPQPSACVFWCSPESFGVHMLTRGVLPPHRFMEHSDLGRAEYCEQPEESPVGSHTQPGPKQAASGPFCTMRHLIKEMASQGKMFYGCFYKIRFKLQFIFCGSLQIDG